MARSGAGYALQRLERDAPRLWQQVVNAKQPQAPVGVPVVRICKYEKPYAGRQRQEERPQPSVGRGQESFVGLERAVHLSRGRSA